MHAPLCGRATRLQLLSKIGALAGLLEYDQVVAEVARLSIPELADWCIVDVVQQGEPRRVEVAQRDPARAALAADLRRLKQDTGHRHPSRQAVLSGRSLLYPDFTEQMYREQGGDGRALALFRELEVRSLMVVPLMVRGRAVAVAAFLTTAESGRRYGPEDLALAEELAERAAQLVDNARLHAQLKRSEAQFRVALAHTEQVMGILGHDLRNPLGAVRVLASLLLRREDLPGRAREQVAEIDRAGKRMLEMIGTLLDFSESRFKGSVPIAPVAMDLHPVARAVVGELLAANPGREIELELRGDGRGVWDPARMAQVISNLVGNALTHGAPRVPVHVTVGDEGTEIALRVKNEGAPIPRELLPVLFEPFRRGSPRRDGSHARGLGLGLYIAQQIVGAHGGEIAVHSTAEDGTTFAVRLPRGAATPARPDGAASESLSL